MSTKDVVNQIKQGDRVVYAIGDVEYNAVALGTAHVGYNPAMRLHSAFLSLVYLNEQGTAIKVFGAPILGSEVDDEHLVEAAADARKRDPRNAGASFEYQVELSSEHFDRLKANPRTIGWRTGSADDDKRPEAKQEQPAPDESSVLVCPTIAELETLLNSNIPVYLNPDGTVTTSSAHAVAESMLKSSGIDGDAGDWTQAGMDETGFPVPKGSETDVTEVSPATPTLAPEPAESSNPTPAEVTEAPVTTAAVPSDGTPFAELSDEEKANTTYPTWDGIVTSSGKTQEQIDADHARIDSESDVPSESESSQNE